MIRPMKLDGQQLSRITHCWILLTLIALALLLKQWLYEEIAASYCCLQSDNLDTLPLRDFWKLLLPSDGGGAGFTHWGSSGMAAGELIRRLTGNLHNANLVFLALAMCAAYWCGINIYKNLISAIVLTLLVGLGTHLNYVYYHNHVGVFNLFIAYVLLNISFGYKIVFEGETDLRYRIGFILSLLLIMVFSEIWVNYFAFLLCSVFFLWFLSIRHSGFIMVHRIKPLAISVLVLMALYLPIRLSYGVHLSTPGGEEEVIFTYPSLVLMLDDFIVNIFTFLHASLTSFIPPIFTFSNSLSVYGSSEIMAQQNGYHPAGTHLVPYSHLFLWRFVAGGVVFGFAYFFARKFYRCLITKELRSVLIVLLCIMILVGFASHSIIKFRPYNSTPFLTYKCITSVIGVYLLTAGFFSSTKLVRSTFFFRSALFCLLFLILVNSFTRPIYENTAYNETHLWYRSPYTNFSF